ALVLGLGMLLLTAFQMPSIHDAAISAALAAYNAQSAHLFDYVEVGRTMDPEQGGVVYMRLRDRTTGAELQGIVEWLVVLPDGSGWRTLFPGDAGYTASYAAFHPDLAREMTDHDIREQGDEL